MHDGPVEQIGDGGKADMRMRPHVHALAGDELHRAEMVEEDEGPDHLPLAMRQRAPHLETVAEIAGSRHDDEIERITCFGIAEHGIVVGHPAHGGLLLFCSETDASRIRRRRRDKGRPHKPLSSPGQCAIAHLDRRSSTPGRQLLIR
jgi:hypothetical protein